MAFVKILEVAAKKMGGLAALHTALIRHGVNISLAALSQSIRSNSRSMRFDVLSGIANVVFGGDWAKVGKIIDNEFDVDE